jgi:hypothetical protein
MMKHPYDPHFVHAVHLDIWRDFDKGVAQEQRRQRRARLLAALRVRRNRMPGGTGAPTPFPTRVPQHRFERHSLRIPSSVR